MLFFLGVESSSRGGRKVGGLLRLFSRLLSMLIITLVMGFLEMLLDGTSVIEQLAANGASKLPQPSHFVDNDMPGKTRRMFELLATFIASVGVFRVLLVVNHPGWDTILPEGIYGRPRYVNTPTTIGGGNVHSVGFGVRQVIIDADGGGCKAGAGIDFCDGGVDKVVQCCGLFDDGKDGGF